MGEIERYEALIARADALGDEADRLVTGSVNVSNTAAHTIADDVLRLVADYRGAVEALRELRDAGRNLATIVDYDSPVNVQDTERWERAMAAADTYLGGQ